MKHQQQLHQGHSVAFARALLPVGALLLIALFAFPACERSQVKDDPARALPGANGPPSTLPVPPTTTSPPPEPPAPPTKTDACPAKGGEMVRLNNGAGYSYCIDRTEVTQANYEVFLSAVVGKE